MDKELLDKIIELVKTTPNDMELGQLVRELINNVNN
jgi:hypothetical protein